MKRNNTLIVLIVILTMLLVAWRPLFQDDSSLITLNMDAIIEQVRTAVSEEYKELITALEGRVTALEERNSLYEQQLSTLQVIASMPTLPPQAATATVGEGTETPEPTRTPNPSGYDCETQVLMPYYFGEFTPGAPFTFRVLVTNTGNKTWGNEVNILHLEGLKAEAENHYAYAMPISKVDPGDQMEINISMIAPLEKTQADGKYESYYVLNNGDEDFCTFDYAIYVP